MVLWFDTFCWYRTSRFSESLYAEVVLGVLILTSHVVLGVTIYESCS